MDLTSMFNPDGDYAAELAKMQRGLQGTPLAPPLPPKRPMQLFVDEQREAMKKLLQGDPTQGLGSFLQEPKVVQPGNVMREQDILASRTPKWGLEEGLEEDYHLGEERRQRLLDRGVNPESTPMSKQLKVPPGYRPELPMEYQALNSLTLEELRRLAQTPRNPVEFSFPGWGAESGPSIRPFSR